VICFTFKLIKLFNKHFAVLCSISSSDENDDDDDDDDDDEVASVIRRINAETGS